MARQRKNVPTAQKKRLRAEAGGKCANPGCPTQRTELHHIREWAVFETNDSAHMIAVCPTCHDAIHHGEIPISDETVYAWKGIRRSTETVQTHLYVEPAAPVRLLLGSIAVETREKAIIFDLGPNVRLSFSVSDGDILLLDLRIAKLGGHEVLRVVNNHLKYESDVDVRFRTVPGVVNVFVPRGEPYLPDWALSQMRSQDPTYGLGGRIKALGLRVLEPGLLRVEGVWATDENAVIITQTALSFLTPDRRAPLSMKGEGKNSVLLWNGPINSALFNFGVPPTPSVSRVRKQWGH